MQETDFRPLEVRTRFLYPFTFDAEKFSLETLRAAFVKERMPDRPNAALKDEARRPHVWIVPQVGGGVGVPDAGGSSPRGSASATTPHVQAHYVEDFSEHIGDLLFRPSRPAEKIGGCYLRMADEVCSQLFPNRKLRAVAVTDRQPKPETLDVKLDILAVELFLSEFGAGTLSFTLAPEGLADLDAVKSFNYWLSQLRDSRHAQIAYPHKSEDPKQWEKLKDHWDKIPPPPDPDAPLLERSGREGCRFHLEELKNDCLRPFGDGAHPTQTQFSVYTVVRFGTRVRFANRQCREALGPPLAGLSQVEEATHPGAPDADSLGVETALLNAQHWAAVSSLGAAHFVADDHQPPRDFDTERVHRVSNVYFIPFLLAYFQRLFLGQIEGRAATEARLAGHRRVAGKRDANTPILRDELLLFDLLAMPRHIGQREAHNRAYRLAQAGMDITRTFQDVNRAVSAMESANELESQRKGFEEIVSIQKKVEGVEVFVVAIYSIYFFHYAGDPFFGHRYVGGWVIGGSAFAALVAAMHLQHYRWMPRRKFPPIPTALVIVLAYLCIGAVWFRKTEEATRPGAAEQQVDGNHAGGKSPPGLSKPPKADHDPADSPASPGTSPKAEPTPATDRP